MCQSQSQTGNINDCIALSITIRPTPFFFPCLYPFLSLSLLSFIVIVFYRAWQRKDLPEQDVITQAEKGKKQVLESFSWLNITHLFIVWNPSIVEFFIFGKWSFTIECL